MNELFNKIVYWVWYSWGFRKRYETEGLIDYLWGHVAWCLCVREITFFWQRRTRGFDSSELWSLDYTFIKYMLPRLKAFRNLHNGKGPMGFPAGIVEDFNLGQIKNIDGWAGYDEATTHAGMSVWLQTIDKMILAMEIFVRDDGYPFNERDRVIYQEGMDLFFIYFNALWD